MNKKYELSLFSETLKEAKKGYAEGDIPIGSILVLLLGEADVRNVQRPGCS